MQQNNITMAIILQAQTGGAKAVEAAMQNVGKATKAAETAAKSLTTSQKQLTTTQQNLTKVNNAATLAAKKLNDANIAVQAGYLKVENAAAKARAMLQNYADVENEAGVTTERLEAASKLAADALAQEAAANKDVEAAMSAANDAADREAAAFDAVSAASQKVADAQAQVATATTDAKDAQIAAAEAMDTMGTAGEYLNGVLESVEATLEAFLPLIALQAVQALFSFGQQSVQAAGDFQQLMTKIQTTAAPATENIKNMGDAIRQLSMDTGKAVDDLANALYYVESRGYSAAAALVVVRDSAEAAQIGMFDTQTAADAVTSVMNVLKVKAADASAVFDEMQSTVSLGAMQWGEYARGIGNFTSIMHQAHVSLTEGSAALDTLTSTGLGAQHSMQLLGTMFTYMSAGVLTIAKRADKLGLSFDLQKFQTMTLAQKMDYLWKITKNGDPLLLRQILQNQTMYGTFVKLHGQMGTYTSDLNKLQNSQGSLASAWQKTSQNYNTQSQKMKAAFDELGMTIGNALLPYLTKIVKDITPIIVQFANWLTSSKSLEKGLKNGFHAIYVSFKLMTDEIDIVLKAFQGNWQGVWFDLNDMTSGQMNNIEHNIL